MKNEKNMLIAFLLNLFFSIFELVGGFLTGSVAILSDALHDVGDAASIGVSYALEKKSKRQPDESHTYGYGRYSVLGSVLTTVILLSGSVMVTVNAVGRILNPTPIDYRGMIVFAIVGVAVNFLAAFLTRKGDSLNQKAVNLHLLEDVLGWVVVLLGAIVMQLTDFALLDPIMSIGVAVFIFWNALGNLKEALSLFLEKTPHGISVEEVVEKAESVEGVLSVHHVHLWSMNGQDRYATMHVVAAGDPHHIKEHLREELHELGISHATLELEAEGEPCHEDHCHTEHHAHEGHHHHHHHH